MRIVIDLQGAQTRGSRFRGIGRYSLGIAKAIARNRGKHEVIIALNGLFPETIEPIRSVFAGLLAQENIQVWYAPGPVCESKQANKRRYNTAEHIREVFLESLGPDVIFITSPFEGWSDEAVISIGASTSRIPTVVTMHDLIPLLHSDIFLAPYPRFRKFYFRRIDHIKQALYWRCQNPLRGKL